MFLFWLVVIASACVNQQLNADGHNVVILVFVMMLIYAAVYSWFIQDAKDIGVRPSKALQFGVIVGASLCVPYYLVRYKGWKRSCISFLKFSLLFMLSSVAFAALPALN